MRETDGMQVRRNPGNTVAGRGEWFSGAVYIDPVATPSQGSRLSAGSVHTAGARTAWHTHPHGQTIVVTDGVGRAQRHVGRLEEIRPGDRVFVEPGEDHWHGAAPDRFMTHPAMFDVDEHGTSAAWADQVTDAGHDATPVSGASRPPRPSCARPGTACPGSSAT